MSVDSALGAALSIPQSALDKIKEADEKLVKIQQTARDTASSVRSSFDTMTGGTSGFIGALDQIISKLGTIDRNAKNMSGSLNNIGATKAAQDVTQMNGAIIRAAENIDKMSASQRKVATSSDLAKSISDWNEIGLKIEAIEERQKRLNGYIRNYENNLKNGGKASSYNTASYEKNIKEYESNEKVISSLRLKQQQIVENNRAIRQQISYYTELNSLPNQRAKNDLQSLNEYYKNLEKTSKKEHDANQKKIDEANKAAEAAQKAYEKEAKAAEEAEKKKRAEWNKTTSLYADKRHNERQSMYNNLFGLDKMNDAKGKVASLTAQIDILASKYREMKAPDFGPAYEESEKIKQKIAQITEENKKLTASIKEQDDFRARITTKAPALKKGEYDQMKQTLSDNQKEIEQLKEKQVQILSNAQAENAAWRQQRQAAANRIADLQKEKQMIEELRTKPAVGTTMDDARSKQVLARMREYYTEEEKRSAKAAKDAEREAKATESAEERKRDAWAKSTAAYGQQYHNERQAMYNQLFSVKNSTVPTALANTQGASTLREHVAAIKELQQARLNLVTTDKNYKQNLAAVNEAIKQHSKVLKDAGLNARNLGEQYSYLSGYLSRLAQRTAVVFSMSAAKDFVNNIAEVRGQMEMSQRSLESILQNKPKADEIFNKTVELAVKSPFRIKDLVDYTRQLSAYRIESDKLYDTTKRLADVSAGLGVDMGRLILAYGQVKAAAYLRGSEVRQFTEAGINMYGELQEYFKEVKGEAYTTAQIVDMISKRKVSFEDVEAIFQRMTDKGGTFYNMQEVQAETLQGKISNLHDAFDVMLNDIGKANEGTLKGMISATTTLLNNWQAIAETVKAIVALVGILYVQSVKTGVSMSKVFSINFAQEATKNATLLQLLKNGFKSAGAAAITFGKNLKTAFVSNIWLIAIAGIVEAIVGVYDIISEYNKKVREAQEETIKTQGAIGAITSSYNELANAANNANKSMDSKDLEKNINDRRAALQKLIDLAAKDGLTFKINVDTVKDEDLDKTFKEIEKKYKNFVDDIESMRKNYAASQRWNTWLTDGIGDNLDDYKNAVIDVLSQSSEMETAVAAITANYDKATASTKKYFDIIRAGQKDGESNLDYWNRMTDAMQQINRLSTGSDYLSPEWLENVQGNIADMIKGFNKVKEKAQDVGSNFDEVFGDLRKKYNNDPIRIQAAIDRVAAENDWSQYARDLAYHYFGINVSIDKDSAKKEVNWVDDYLADFFAKKKYGINLVVKTIDDDKVLENFVGRGDQAAKAAKQWQELEKRIAAVAKNKKEIDVDDSLRKLFRADDPRISGKKIDVSTLREMIVEYKKAATAQALALGVDPFEKQNNKKNTTANAKQERDILQERINLLKDMNSKYNELIKTESKERALSDTRKYFKEAAQNVGWKAEDILPDDKSVIKRIRELGATAKEIGKRGGYFRVAADIEFKIKDKTYSELKDDITKNIDEAFSKLDLYKKLKEQGLTDEAIKSMFGDIVSSFEEVGEAIDNEFNRLTFESYAEKYGEDFNKWGEKVIAQYNADLEKTKDVMAQSGEETNKLYLEKRQKLDEKIAQEQVAQAQELIKSYKTQLTEQLQLDKWYYSEKMSIMNNANLKENPELQQQLIDNLTSQFNKKQADINWKDFQNSNTYISIFENLEHTSTKVLDYMIAKLKTLREQLKGLDPTQVKAITEQITKIEATKNSRNPFKSFVSGLKEMTAASKEFKKLGGIDAWVSKNNSLDSQKQSLQYQEDLVAKLEAEYKQMSDNKELDTDKAKQLKLNLDLQKGILKSKKEENKTTKEEVDNLDKSKNAQEKAKSKFATSVSDITNMVSAMGQAFNTLASSLGNTDETLSNSVNFLDHAGQAIGSFYSQNWAGVVSNAVGAIGDVINIFSSEGKIDKEIARQERAVNRLQYAYDNLKKSMDDAFDIQRLSQYHDKSVETLKEEQKAYEAMINAERGRKHPDDSKIDQWQQQIQELEKTIKELDESLTESLGGFGSEANYKSAAQAFADAWVDAFNEGSDALEALNDKFDEYFTNMLKKQLMQRAAQKYIEPILKAFDEAVSEGSDGGNNGYELTKDEIAHIKDLKETNLKAFDTYAKNLMDVLGVTPGGSSNLSNLQQGIQSVTETTAQALESILNSMRFYVAQQQSDIAAIRLILEQRLGAVAVQAVEGGASNQMLALMEQQAGYLRQICDNWSSVMKSGHNQGGKGLKVFMN